VTPVLHGLLFRCALVVEDPLLRHVRRVVGTRRVERIDRRMVEVVCSRVGRIRVAVRPHDREREVLRDPDVAAAVVVLDPVAIVARALAGREAHVVQLVGDPVLDLVEPWTAGVAPAAVRIGGVLEGFLAADLMLHDIVDLLQRERLVRCGAESGGRQPHGGHGRRH